MKKGRNLEGQTGRGKHEGKGVVDKGDMKKGRV